MCLYRQRVFVMRPTSDVFVMRHVCVCRQRVPTSDVFVMRHVCVCRQRVPTSDVCNEACMCL